MKSCRAYWITMLISTTLLFEPLVSSRHIPHSPGSDRRSSLQPKGREELCNKMIEGRPAGSNLEVVGIRRPTVLGLAGRDGEKLDTVRLMAGSRLPDCSHACGPCSPCRLVIVSFVCSSLHEAETCPMAYKCMCRNRSYPMP